jgi:hypothetical protein
MGPDDFVGEQINRLKNTLVPVILEQSFLEFLFVDGPDEKRRVRPWDAKDGLETGELRTGLNRILGTDKRFDLLGPSFELFDSRWRSDDTGPDGKERSCIEGAEKVSPSLGYSMV